MRTAIYIRSLLHGGAEKQAILLAEELQKKEEVLLIVHTHDEDAMNLDFSNLNQIVFLKGINLKKIIHLYSFLKKYKIINLICFLPVNNIIGTIAAKLAGTPNIICGIRGSKYKGYLRTFILKFICNSLKIRFVSNSHLSKKVYGGLGFNTEHISVVHNAVIIPEANISIRRTISDRNSFKLLSVGRYVVEKDFETLLIAIKTLVTELDFKNIHLNLVGYGPLENKLSVKIRELGLSLYITMSDGRSADIKNLYLTSDLYILSSVSEGMPNTVMEAMTYKLPIVTTDAGDVAYLVTEDNGILVRPKDYRAVAAGIKVIFEDKIKYQKLSDESFDKIRRGFSLQKMSAGFREFLK